MFKLSHWFCRLIIEIIRENPDGVKLLAIIFCIYGGLGLLVGILRKQKFYWFFRRTILTFFAISLYPIQMGYAPAESNLVLAIVVMAIPAIFVLEIFGFVFRRFILKTHTTSINY